MSAFNDERKKEVELLRKGLSLEPLFGKPRAMWEDPVFVAVFGDAFIEKTALEGGSSLARSFAVLNHVLKRTVSSSGLSPRSGSGGGGPEGGHILLTESNGFNREVMTQVMFEHVFEEFFFFSIIVTIKTSFIH